MNSSSASTLGKITTVCSQVSLLSTPSSMKLLSRARWPLAENDAEARQARLPAPSMLAPGMPRSTPGTVRVRLTKLRPLSGSASICSLVTVVPSSDEEVCTSGDSACDADRFGHRADFELEVDAHALIDAELDVRQRRPS